MATFTKSAAVAVVAKSMRDMGKVQELMTACAVVAILSGVTTRDLRDMLTSGVDAIGDGMTGKIVPLAVRIAPDYHDSVDGMTAASARDHIATDITARKIAAGNFNALTCRAKNEFTPSEKRALLSAQNAAQTVEAIVNGLTAIANGLPKGPAKARIDVAIAEGTSAAKQANSAEMSRDNSEGDNLALFAPVVAKIEAAQGLIEAIRDDITADPVEADPVEADPVEADPVETDPVEGLYALFTTFRHNAEVVATIRAMVAEFEAAIAEATEASEAAASGSAPVETEKRNRKTG